MTWFWYITKNYLRYFFVAVFIFLFIVTLFDFIDRSGHYFQKYDPPWSLVLKFYIYQVPGLFVQSLPFGALIASVVCFVNLSRKNEIVAFRAAGLSVARMSLPLVVCGLFVVVLSAVASETLLPKFSYNLKYIRRIEIEKKELSRYFHYARSLRVDRKIFQYDNYDADNQKLFGLKIQELAKDDFRPVKRTFADLAVFDHSSATWMLYDAKEYSFNSKGEVQGFESGDLPNQVLPFEPDKLQTDARKVADMSIGDLASMVHLGDKSGMNVEALRVEYHIKIGFLFASLIVSLVGLRFAYFNERNSELLKGVLFAFLIGISYWVIMSMARILGTSMGVPALLAGWLSNILIFGYIMYDLYRLKRA